MPKPETTAEKFHTLTTGQAGINNKGVATMQTATSNNTQTAAIRELKSLTTKAYNSLIEGNPDDVIDYLGAIMNLADMFKTEVTPGPAYRTAFRDAYAAYLHTANNTDTPEPPAVLLTDYPCVYEDLGKIETDEERLAVMHQTQDAIIDGGCDPMQFLEVLENVYQRALSHAEAAETAAERAKQAEARLSDLSMRYQSLSKAMYLLMTQPPATDN